MTNINSLTRFVPGTKALASEINDNFEVLRQKHNDQEARLNTLEEEYLVNIEKAGAKCDGVTDDFAIVQSILDSGKFPYIPKNKTCIITQTLVFAENGQKIIGADSYTSILKWGGTTDSLMINASKSQAGIENIRIDGNNISGVIGINLALTASTYNQILKNVRIINCPSYGIQGHENDVSPVYFSNDGTFKNVQATNCGIGMGFRVPNQNLYRCMFNQCTVGLAAYINSRINMIGCIFSTNVDDIHYNAAHLNFYGCWFENGSGKIFDKFSGTPALGMINIQGCHFHTNTTNTYIIDLSVATGGTFIFIGNNFDPASTTVNLLLSNNVNNVIHNNTGIGTYVGQYDLVRNDNKTKIMAASYNPVIGLSSVFGTALYITPMPGYTTYIPLQLKIVTTGISGETVTVRFEVGFYDYGATRIVDVVFTTNTTYWLTNAEIGGLFKDNTYIRNFRMQVKTTGASSSAAVTVTPIMQTI